MGETSVVAAARELEEQAGIAVPVADLRQVGAFDAPGRDPRGRYVSIAYSATLLAPTLPTAGDDATAARWWPLEALPDLAFDHPTSSRPPQPGRERPPPARRPATGHGRPARRGDGRRRTQGQPLQGLRRPAPHRDHRLAPAGLAALPRRERLVGRWHLPERETWAAGPTGASCASGSCPSRPGTSRRFKAPPPPAWASTTVRPQHR
ncbi:NUDIX domain-containing protein [Streptomyces rochei]|uniref:NUDIX domain-containing protein n=1 Tax=Streptomyces rochei TaxID=1928 RepID=UPI0036CDC81E